MGITVVGSSGVQGSEKRVGLCHIAHHKGQSLQQSSQSFFVTSPWRCYPSYQTPQPFDGEWMGRISRCPLISLFQCCWNLGCTSHTGLWYHKSILQFQHAQMQKSTLDPSFLRAANSLLYYTNVKCNSNSQRLKWTHYTEDYYSC